MDAWVLRWLVPEAALVEEFEEFQALPAGSSRLLPGAPENSDLAKTYIIIILTGSGQQVEEALVFRPRLVLTKYKIKQI